MTSDRMQDVFPIEFEFKNGEQPTAEKLTGFVKQTNSALARVTGNVGDPLDYQSHSGSSGNYDLSSENLAQANVARIIGPSDYLSPRGGCFNQGISSSITVTLTSNRNSWNLGFPLVKVASGHIDPEESAYGVTALDWGSEIVVTLGAATLATRRTTAVEVVAAGDFYVDFYAGTIVSYSRAVGQIQLTISTMNMLGPGVPWATHNVIPSWDDTDSFLSPVEGATVYGTTTWRMNFPVMIHSSRKPVANTIKLKGRIDTGGSSATSFANFSSIYSSGATSYYRMPNQIVDNLIAGDELPEGFVYLWDEDAGRVLPIATFKYYSENAITVEAPEGFIAADGRYRLIIVGSSITENISFLNTLARDNTHVGLSMGQATDTLFYTPPLSHDNLTELYSTATSSTLTGLEFTKSSYPTNPHPQYLHRRGWMLNDKTGNSGNAMRGDLVFTSTQADFSTDTGYNHSSYGIYFGSNPNSTTSKIKLWFDGGENKSTWTAGSPAVRYGFDYSLNSSTYKGALVVSSEDNQPLYLQTSTANAMSRIYGVAGAALGLDYSNYHEMNYLKLCLPSAARSFVERAIQPAHFSGASTTALPITPGLNSGSVHQRISSLQMREFRFRSGSYNTDALNKENSIGAVGYAAIDTGIYDGVQYDVYGANNAAHTITLETSHGDVTEKFIVGRHAKVTGGTGFRVLGYTITAVNYVAPRTVITVNSGEALPTTTSTAAKFQMVSGEFDAYYNSPAVVGTDFLNVYLNAIFFSDTGNGQSTSFLDNGERWLDHGEADKTPSGIYFIPATSADGPYLSFYGYDKNYLGDTQVSTQPFSVGDRHGMWYAGDGPSVSISGDLTGSSTWLGLYTVLGYRSLIMTKKTEDHPVANIGLHADGGGISLYAITQVVHPTGVYGTILLTTSQAYGADHSGDILLTTGNGGGIGLSTGTGGNITLATGDAADMNLSARQIDILSAGNGINIQDSGAGDISIITTTGDISIRNTLLDHQCHFEIDASGTMLLSSDFSISIRGRGAESGGTPANIYIGNSTNLDTVHIYSSLLRLYNITDGGGAAADDDVLLLDNTNNSVIKLTKAAFITWLGI